MQAAHSRTLIASLNLQPHPEGGWYREVFRSSEGVVPADGRGARCALTSIYFLLEPGQLSRWHRVLADEAWVHLEGAPLQLWTWDAGTDRLQHRVLGPVAPGTLPQAVVPAGHWQAARPQGQGGTLVACLVGPGFDFADFALLDPQGAEAQRLRAQGPQAAQFL